MNRQEFNFKNLSDTSKTSIQSFINNEEYASADGKLLVPIGITEEQKFFYQDISRIPHILIAGTTGSGKTAFIQSILATLALQYDKDDFNCIIFDSKRIDYLEFKNMKNLLVPVLTDTKKVAGLVSWANAEATRRIKILEDGISADTFSDMFIIIDDYYELSLNKEFSDELLKLLKVGRIAKIHCIISTSTPTAKVISTELKANIPCRITFLTASKMDSRIIIDENGAECLNIPGEMIFKGQNQFVKCQSLYIPDEDIKTILNMSKKTSGSGMSQLGEQATTIFSGQNTKMDQHFDKKIMDEIEALNRGITNNFNKKTYKDNQILDRAKQIVIEAGQASTSLLQRKLKLGYAEAARVLDELEQCGIVGPYNGSKPRVVLTAKTSLEKSSIPQITLTPQSTIRFGGTSICVQNNKVHIEISKRLNIGMATCKFDLKPENIKQLIISKATIFKKGYICFGLPQGIDISFRNNDTYVNSAFSYLANDKSVTIEFDKSNMPFFKRFIEQIGKDLKMPIDEK